MGIARSAGRLVGKLANPSWKPPKPKPAWHESNNKITNIVARHRRGTNDFIVDSKSNNEHDLYIVDHNPDKSSTEYKKVATIGNFSRIDRGNTRTRTQSENPMNSENRGITYSGLSAVVEHLRSGGYDVHALNKGDNAKKPVFQGKMVHPLSRHSTTYKDNRYENYFRLKPKSDEAKTNDRFWSTQNKPKPQVQKALEYNPSPPKAPPSNPEVGLPSGSDKKRHTQSDLLEWAKRIREEALLKKGSSQSNEKDVATDVGKYLGNRTTVRTRRRGKQGASVKNPTVTPADVEKLAEPPTVASIPLPKEKKREEQTPVEQAEAYVSQIPEGLKRDRNLGGNVRPPTKGNIETALNVDVTKFGDLDKLPIDMSQEEIANLDKAIAASAFGQSDLNQRASGVVDPNKKLSNAVGIYSRRFITNPETGEKTTVGNNDLENYQIMAGVVKGIDSPETKRLQQVADALQYQKSQYDRADAVEGEGNASEANAIREAAKDYGWRRAAAVDTEGLGDASKVKGEIPTYLHEVSTGIMDRDPETGELANLEALKALNTGTSQYNKNMKDVRGPGLKTFGVPTNHISLDRDPNVRQNMIASAGDDKTSDERAFQAYLANAEPSEDPGGYRIDAPEKFDRDLQPTSNIDRIAQGVATRIAGIYAPSKLNSLHASVSGEGIRIAKPGTFSTSEDEDGRQTSSGKWNRFTTENAEKSAWKGINDVDEARKLAFDWTTNHVRDQYTENAIKYINSLSGDKKEKFVNNNVENILKNLIEQQRQGAISPETDTSGHPFSVFRAEDKRYDLGNFELSDRLLNATPPLPASPIGGKGFTTEEIDRYLNPEKSTEFTNPLKAEIALTHNLDTERTEQYLNIMNSMPQTPGVINASETARRQLGMNKVKDDIATDLPQDMPDVVPDPVDPFERTYTPPADASEVPPDPPQAILTKGLARRSKAGNPDAQGSTPPVESPDQNVIANIENYLLPEQSALSQAAPVAKPAAAPAPASQAQEPQAPAETGVGRDVGIHFGDGSVGRDTTLSRMDAERGTGHFGTGVYFLSSTEKGGKLRSERPVTKIDLTGLNLAKPIADDGQKLHDGLREFHRAVLKGNTLDFSDPQHAGSKSLFDINAALGSSKHSKAEIASAMKQVEELFSKGENDKARTPATYLMQVLGYDGIDVRGSRLDNTAYGSVVFQRGEIPEPSTPPPQASIIDQVNSHIAPGRGTTDRSGKVADTMEARASKTLKREANRNAIPLSFKKQVPKGYTAEVFQGDGGTLTPKFVKRVTGSTGILREKVGKKNEYRVVSLTDTHYGLNAGTGLDEKHATRMAKLLDYLGRRSQRTTGGSNPIDAVVKNPESGMQYRTLFAISKRGRRPGNTQ